MITLLTKEEVVGSGLRHHPRGFFIKCQWRSRGVQISQWCGKAKNIPLQKKRKKVSKINIHWTQCKPWY